MRRADRGPPRRRRHDLGVPAGRRSRSASRTARSSSATPPTCWSPAAASRRPTTPTPRSARWPSAWRWARPPGRPRRWPSPARRDPRDVDAADLRDRLRADGAILELAGCARRGAHDLRPDRPRRHRPVGDSASTYAHEHLVIDGGRPVQMEPDFDLGRRRRDGDGARRARRRSACGPSSTRCRATPAATRQARRAVPPDRRPRRRPDRAPPRPLLRAGALERTGFASKRSPTLFVADIDRGHRRLRLLRPVVERTTHRAGVIKVAGSDGRTVGRATGAIFEAAAAAHRRDRRPDPHPLRGRDRRARAGPPAGRPRRRAGAHRAQPRRQGRRPRLPPRAARRPARSPSTTGRSAGAMARTARSSCSSWAGRGRPARPGRPRAWTPRGRATTRCTVARPGLTWLLGGFSATMEERGLERPIRARLFVDESGPGVRLRRRRPEGGAMTDRLLHQRRRLARPPVVVRLRASPPPSAASSGRSTSRRCSTTRSTSRCATRRRPASTSSATARCAGPASSPPSSTGT